MKIKNIFLKKILCKFSMCLAGDKTAKLERYYGIKEAIRQAPQHRTYFCGIPICRSVVIGDVKSYRILKIPFITYQKSAQKGALYLFGLAVFKGEWRMQPACTGLNLAHPWCSREVAEINLQSLARKMGSAVRKGQKCLFCDMSFLVEYDARSGIQRVVRNIFFSLLKQAPTGYEVLPVYLCDGEYKVAYSYLKSNGCNVVEEYDYRAIFLPGDVLLMLELHCGNFYKEFFKLGKMQRIRADGVKVFSVLYDLIALRYTQFAGISAAVFEGYVRSLHELDGVIAISQFVAEGYKSWLAANQIEPRKDFLIDWFHLGADFVAEDPAKTKGIPEGAGVVWEAMAKRPTLLPVSTIEPRKGYGQALGAFEQLWKAGVDVNFVIVGKHGWKVDELVGKIKKHKELGKRLFWLQSISDEYLEQVYSRADGVLFASEAEGFGLAIIEGAHYGKPLILRDLPVFREIAGEHATYFSGLDDQSLADCIKSWLIQLKKGKVVSSAGIKPLTWAESTRMLISKLPL